MKVFKFGGSGIENADRIRNLATILRDSGIDDLLVVVSAMGKTTNKLEKILQAYLNENDYEKLLVELFDDFFKVCNELFPSEHFIFEFLKDKHKQIVELLKKYESQTYNFLYDQVISQGELISSQILTSYLNLEGIDAKLLDARKLIKTNSAYRDATVDWKETQKKVSKELEQKHFYITQGFIASDSNGYTTTLGREGSDYTSAIIAHCTEASELVIWKDVEGVLNADPRYFEDTTLLSQISFQEAIELAYYGASVIHPKTIQPLHCKKIPLRVRSFLDTKKMGTVITQGEALVPNMPCYILKKDQQLLNISSRNFSFIVEDDISDIFKVLSKHGMKVNLLNNSAISLSLCLDDSLGEIESCISDLKEKYEVCLTSSVTLYTIRNFEEEDFMKRLGDVVPLLKQIKNNVMHFVVK